MYFTTMVACNFICDIVEREGQKKGGEGKKGAGGGAEQQPARTTTTTTTPCGGAMATQGVGDTRVLVAKLFCVWARACKERESGVCVKNRELKKREGATGEKGVARGAWGCFPTHAQNQRPPKESRHREGKRTPRLLSSFRRLIAFVTLTAVCDRGSPRFRFAPVVCAHTFAFQRWRASTCGCCWGKWAMQALRCGRPPPPHLLPWPLHCTRSDAIIRPSNPSSRRRSTAGVKSIHSVLPRPFASIE